jgi:hypothetical protein
MNSATMTFPVDTRWLTERSLEPFGYLEHHTI